jgi:hypothetical protein
MYYVCIEDGKIATICNYLPEVPTTITIVEITDDEHKSIVVDRSHYFDVSAQAVVPVAQEVSTQQQQELHNAPLREQLNSTDWKVLRHIREKTLNIPTSLTEQEYLALETERNSIASQII